MASERLRPDMIEAEREVMMRGFKIFGALVVGVATGLVMLPSTANAAAPERGTFSDSSTGTDPAGTTCSFPVHFAQVESGSYEVFSDAQGNFVRVQIHTNYNATISANGHVLNERDTFTRTIFDNGTMRDVGLTVHILGPSGLLIRDAGQIVYSDTNETLSYVRGPHPQLFGTSFCEALV
jgi:hypothetical protein